jgi:hypothetical protein
MSQRDDPRSFGNHGDQLTLDRWLCVPPDDGFAFSGRGSPLTDEFCKSAANGLGGTVDDFIACGVSHVLSVARARDVRREHKCPPDNKRGQAHRWV